MESLQLAQMLADLSDLSAAQESQAAVALVTANKTIAQSSSHSELPRPAEQRNHQRVASQSSILSRTASPARFDMKGRRLLTPPISRTNSAQGSMPGTPREEHPDDDVNRAGTLMALYEIREKLKQQDSMGLAKAREKIIALEAKRQAQTAAEKKDGAEARQSRYTFPKPPQP